MIDYNQFLNNLNNYIHYENNFDEKDIKSIDKYLHLDLEIEDFEDYLVINFYSRIKDFNVTKLEISCYSDYFDFDYLIYDGINQKAGLATLFYLIQKALNDPSSDVFTSIKNAIDDFVNQSINIYKKMFHRSINELSITADKLDLMHDLNPVKIYPVLVLYRNGDIYLKGKIGRDKIYQINNWDKFFSLVQRSANFKYGKNLEFEHHLHSFDERSQKLINFLKTREFMYTKQAQIDDETLSYILNLYKGEDILFEEHVTSFNDEYIHVRLENRNYHLHIDNKYILNIVNENDESIGNNFIFNKYIFDYDNRIIDIIDGNETFVSLINEIFISPYPSVEDIIDDFKYNFIARFPNKFIIDDQIKDEFAFDDLNIEAYFDYEKKIVTLSEKLYLDNKPIEVEKLNHRLEGLYRKYRNVISHLGFVDNALEDEGKILEFFSSSLETLKQYCSVYLSESILNKTVSKFNPPNIKINYDSDLLSVFLEDSRYSDEELFAIINGIKQKKKFVLYNNQIINIDNEVAKSFYTRLENFNLNEKRNIKENKLPIYYAFKVMDDSSGINLNEKIIDVFNQIKNYKNNTFIPGSIDGNLRTYQIEGIKWLDVLYKNGLCGILADDMGLGKTIEIISFLKGEKINGNCLIVAPKSLIFNWKNEFNKFAPDLEISQIYGTMKEREDIIQNINHHQSQIYITSYDSLRRDEKLYNDIEFDTLILDEAQYIKNSKAQKTISAYHLKSKHRFVLTGTPIENSILDLWSIFNFLMPGYLLKEDEFKRRYENDIEYASIIKKYVAPFILRRTKKDVLKDLPDKFETIISCEMVEEQKKIYAAHKLLAKQELLNGGKAFDVLPYLMRLRQICIHPSLFIDNYHGESGKINELYELLNDRISSGHHILIFSQFVMALNLVTEYLNENNINYFMITGSTNGEDRVKLANEFNTNKKYKVGLISLKAGGTGLNLVGADVVIHLDPWWNVAAEDQATDRAYRIGQKKNVEVIKLICENSIEQRVVELQNKKKDIVDKIIAKDDTSITQLSLEDMNFILK